MSFGAKVWHENRQSYMDVLQPTWCIDARYGLKGSGTLSYDFDSGIFKLVPVFSVIGLSYGYNDDQFWGISVTVAGNTVSYKTGDKHSINLMVFLESK